MTHIKKSLNKEIDIGLSVLMLNKSPGQILNQTDIASVCGCSRSRIQQIENSALAKLQRKRLMRDLNSD